MDSNRPYSALNNDVSYKLDEMERKKRSARTISGASGGLHGLETQKPHHRDLLFLLPEAFITEQARNTTKEHSQSLEDVMEQIASLGGDPSETAQRWHVMNFSKPLPVGRLDAIRLEKWLQGATKSMAEMHLRETKNNNNKDSHLDFVSDAVQMYSIGVHEIIRQTAAECVERGRTLGMIWVRFTNMMKAIVSQFKKERNLYFCNIES